MEGCARHVKVDGPLGDEVRVGVLGEAEGESVGLEERESDLSTLLDDLSKLAGKKDGAATWHRL